MAQSFLVYSCLPIKPKRYILTKVIACLIAIVAVTYFVGGWAMGSHLLKTDWVLADNYQQYQAVGWNKVCTAVYANGATTPSFDCGGIAETFVIAKNRHMEGIKAGHGICLWFAKYELNLGFDTTPQPDRNVRAFDACWVGKIFGSKNQNDSTAENKPAPYTGLTAENVRTCRESAH